VIRVEDLWRSYEMGEQIVHALHGVNEIIESGEHVAIMGPSGSGKSTLLNIIGCLDRPSRGLYMLDGQAVGGLDEAQLSRTRLQRIGFIFQAFHLVPRLSAMGNVELPMIFAGMPPAERRERAMKALAALGLEPWSQHRPAELSGGQKQRVAIARATIMGPSILLADEPTGNLDTTTGREIIDLLQELRAEGSTIVMVTHDPQLGEEAGRRLYIRDGRVHDEPDPVER